MKIFKLSVLAVLMSLPIYGCRTTNDKLPDVSQIKLKTVKQAATPTNYDECVDNIPEYEQETPQDVQSYIWRCQEAFPK